MLMQLDALDHYLQVFAEKQKSLGNKKQTFMKILHFKTIRSHVFYQFIVPYIFVHIITSIT